MRLLDRYLLRELLVPFGYCLSGFLVFWISFDLSDELSDFRRENLLWTDIAEYYGVKTPELLMVVLPVALLLALLYALTNHARHQEITAIRAAGVSLLRLSVPYAVTGFMLSLALLAMSELWVPKAVDAAEQIRKRRLKNPVERIQREWALKVGFPLKTGGTCYFGAYSLQMARAADVHLVMPRDGGGWEVVDAAHGVWTNGSWMLYDVELDFYPPELEAIPTHEQTNLMAIARMTETPDEVKSHVRVSWLLANPNEAAKRPQLSIEQILAARKYYRKDPIKMMILETQLHGRIAAPWTCLMVVLIAIPFGAAPGRRNVFVGVAASIFICFAYFILMRAGLALGTGGYVTPWLAAWGPNLVFAILGFGLLWRVR